MDVHVAGRVWRKRSLGTNDDGMLVTGHASRPLLPDLGKHDSSVGGAQHRGKYLERRRQLYRYPPGRDGLPGIEGAFLPCSFWLVQALARSRRAFEANALFDEGLALPGPLRLYAEEMDPLTRRYLGNYPQALTHAALVQAAIALRLAGASKTLPRLGNGPTITSADGAPPPATGCGP